MREVLSNEVRVAFEGFLEAQKLHPVGPKTCLEFGVGPGGTYLWQAEQIIKKFQDTTLIGFDSWSGLPPETDGVWCPERHKEGNYAFAKSVTTDGLAKLGIIDDKRFKFVDGFYDKSLTKEVQDSISNVIFINIDVDIYSSSMLVLDFIKPFLKKDVIIYWDDWKDPNDKFEGKWGEHLAWEEWAAKNPEIKTETIIVNEVNQRCMRVL